MSHAVRAELLKLRSIRTPFVIAGCMCAFIVVVVVAQLFPGSDTGLDPATASTQRDIFSAGQIANIFALVVGTLAVTGEYRYGTITSTFLADARRARVVAAKLFAAACIGIAYGTVGALVAPTAAVAGLSLTGRSVVLSRHEVVALAAWPIAQAAGYALLGVTVGLIVRNQVGALVALFVWAVIAESVVAGLAPTVGQYLPVAALGAIGVSDSVSTWAAAAAAAAWVAALAALGTVLTEVRDVM